MNYVCLTYQYYYRDRKFNENDQIKSNFHIKWTFIKNPPLGFIDRNAFTTNLDVFIMERDKSSQLETRFQYYNI